MKRRTFNVEVDFPDGDPTDPQALQVIEAFMRIGAYVPGKIRIVQAQLLPDVAQSQPELPFGTESTPTTSPASSADTSTNVAMSSTTSEAPATFLFPKGLPREEPPAAKPESSINPGLHLTRDLLLPLAQGGYSGHVADFFQEVLDTMPIGCNAVDLHATFCE